MKKKVYVNTTAKTKGLFIPPPMDKGFILIDYRICDDLSILAWYRKGYQLKVICFDSSTEKILAEGLVSSAQALMDARYN